jgi:hypothetical protein
MSLPPDAGPARVVLEGEGLTRLALTLEAERASGGVLLRIKQNFFAALRSSATSPTEGH